MTFFHDTLIEDNRYDNSKDVVNKQLVLVDGVDGEEDEDEKVEEVFLPF